MLFVRRSLLERDWISNGRRWLRLSPVLRLEPTPRKSETETPRHPLVSCRVKWSCRTPAAPVGWLQSVKVVIVGAGLAGLSAAWRLTAAGFTDIIILEALNRPGGRVNTVKLKDGFADLGSSYLYGACVTNPLYNICVTEGVVTSRLQRKILRGPYFIRGGQVVEDVSKAFDIFSSAFDSAEGYHHGGGDSSAAGGETESSSMEYFLTERLRQESALTGTHLSQTLAVINGLKKDSRIRWGEDLSVLSAAGLSANREASHGILKLKQIGASKLLEPFLARVATKIRYKKPVQSIRWRSGHLTGSRRGGVLTCDGEEFPADFILCTVSLGVLKSQAESLFSPPLSPLKMEAIHRLGFGAVNRIFLEYDRPFWSPGYGSIKIGWHGEELLTGSRGSWLGGIGTIEELSPTLLGLSVAGREAVWTEASSTEDLAMELTHFLRTLTANPGIPCPKRLIRTRWCSDVYFNGALSYIGTQTGLEWVDCLGCPLPDPCNPVLLFAGEATARDAQASMTGAVLSGLREADRLVELCSRRLHKGEHLPPRLKPCPLQAEVQEALQGQSVSGGQLGAVSYRLYVPVGNGHLLPTSSLPTGGQLTDIVLHLPNTYTVLSCTF